MCTSGGGEAAEDIYLLGFDICDLCIGSHSIFEEVAGFFTFLVFPSEMLCVSCLLCLIWCTCCSLS